MKKKRDAEYYKKRLAKDHPALFAEVRSGRLSVRAASAKAGLIHLPTRLDALKREWKGASKSQQDEFQEWLKAPALKRGAKTIADFDGRLRSNVRGFLSRWVKSNRSKPGRIMKQMGLSRHDFRLSMAIYGGHELPPEVISSLEDWLPRHGFR
jgi:hypothetical protein